MKLTEVLDLVTSCIYYSIVDWLYVASVESLTSIHVGRTVSTFDTTPKLNK